MGRVKNSQAVPKVARGTDTKRSKKESTVQTKKYPRKIRSQTEAIAMATRVFEGCRSIKTFSPRLFCSHPINCFWSADIRLAFSPIDEKRNLFFFFFLHRPKSQSAQTNYDDCRQGTPKSLRHFSLFDAKQKNALFLMKIAAIMYEIPTNSMKSPPKETLTIWPFTDVTIIFDKRINSEKFNLNRIKNYF